MTDTTMHAAVGMPATPAPSVPFPASGDTTMEETLDVLACEIGRRPREAPDFAEIAQSVRRTQRESEALIVEFDPSAVERVAAFVAAERLCCAGIGWELEGTPAVRLRIAAAAGQLDVLQTLFEMG